MGIFLSFLLFLWAVLLLLPLSLFTCPSLSLRQQEFHQSPMSPPLRHRQMRRNPQRLHIMKTRPHHPAPDQVRGIKKQQQEEEEEETKNMGRGRGFGARQVSAMLPRGVVPPSGSSACHNDVPDSLDYYCGGSASAFDP